MFLNLILPLLVLFTCSFLVNWLNQLTQLDNLRQNNFNGFDRVCVCVRVSVRSNDQEDFNLSGILRNVLVIHMHWVHNPLGCSPMQPVLSNNEGHLRVLKNSLEQMTKTLLLVM